MRVGFHLQPAIGGRNTGIGVYTQSLYLALRDMLGDSVIPVGRASDRPIETIGERLWYEQVAIRSLLRAHSIDVFHSTGISYPISLKCPGIGTLFDLAYLKHPEWAGSFASRWFWCRLVPQSHLSAQRIIVLSRAVADSVAEFFPRLRERVRIIPAGLPQDVQLPPDASDQKRRGLLFVGDLSPRKNLVTLLAAFNLLRERGWSEPLYAIGVPRQPDLLPRSSHPLVESGLLIPLGFVDRSSLLHYYRSVRLLVFPSLEEGFGLPPLEALALQTPVLVSDIPVFREVGRDIYHFFPPKDSEALAESILSLLSDTEARSDQLRRAPEFLRKYSWMTILPRILKLYGELRERS
ncbi:MAG: glycosyltransferase family 4 protein [bacterium JZ-2024 1]